MMKHKKKKKKKELKEASQINQLSLIPPSVSSWDDGPKSAGRGPDM